MTPRQLEALRKHLHFTVPEAARWVAASPERPRGVEERTWNRWEAGKVAVPPNIASRMITLVHWRDSQAASIIDAHMRRGSDPTSIIWYDDREDWIGDPAHWRPSQSATAELLSVSLLEDEGVVRLVPFDAQAFNRWRGARPDTAAERAAWASQQPDDTPPPRMVEMRKEGPAPV